MNQFAIGVDIGGTRTKSGLVDLDSGRLMTTIVHPTEKMSEASFTKKLFEDIDEHRRHHGVHPGAILGIGVGVSSFVDGRGVVDSTYGFLPFMESYALQEIIENATGLSCKVDNDARVVALGEALYGKGAKYSRVLVLTLGTGLGLGFVVDRKFQDGLPYAHMGGHLTITQNDFQCYCGKTGCLESLVSSQGIIYEGTKAGWVEKYPHESLTGENIFKLSLKGNRDALHIIERIVDHLRAGIDNYINLYAPDCIILGGGIAQGLVPYLDRLYSKTNLLPYRNYKVAIEVSDLSEAAGVSGAASLFKPQTR